MKLLCYIVLIISITMTTAMKISEVERMTNDYFDQVIKIYLQFKPCLEYVDKILIYRLLILCFFVY